MHLLFFQGFVVERQQLRLVLRAVEFGPGRSDPWLIDTVWVSCMFPSSCELPSSSLFARSLVAVRLCRSRQLHRFLGVDRRVIVVLVFCLHVSALSP